MTVFTTLLLKKIYEPLIIITLPWDGELDLPTLIFNEGAARKDTAQFYKQTKRTQGAWKQQQFVDKEQAETDRS